MSRFAEVAALLGYWPATTDEAHTLRAANVTRVTMLSWSRRPTATSGTRCTAVSVPAVFTHADGF